MNVPVPQSTAQQRAAVRQRISVLAQTLDTAFRIPGTRIRFGVDALIGLIPGIGDLFGLLLGLWLIWQARSVHAPVRLQLRMLANLGLETVVGIVPVVGDTFDVFWKANLRNRNVLIEWMDEQDQTHNPGRSSLWFWCLLGVAVLAGLIAVLR